jgi:D-alanine-D-alanine ligase
MNKYKANQFLYAQGFHIPKQMLLNKKEYTLNQADAFAHLLQSMPFPLIIKPHDDGCSFMIKKAHNIDELQDALEEFYMHKDIALIEECIQGTELTVGCIGNDTVQALPPSKVISNSGILSVEEKFLPGAGENQTPAPLPTPTRYVIQREIEKIYRSLGCKGYARIDCFYQDATESPTGYERVVCIEVNTLPGMTPATVLFHQAAELDISPSALIERIITLGMELHVNRQPAHRSISVMTTR